MSQQRVEVAVFSPQELVALGVRAALEGFPDRFSVLEMTTPGDTGADVADVIVYDGSFIEDNDGRDLQELVDLKVPVVALVPDPRHDLAQKALTAGAFSWVPFSVRGPELLDVVEGAASGKVLTQVARRAGTPSIPTTSEPGFGIGLTGREEDVIRLITRGLSNTQIASELYVSINSVKTYIRTAYRKIGLTSRSQVAVWAVKHGVS